MICFKCGAVAPTRRVRYVANLGLVVARIVYDCDGLLCRPCVGKWFVRYTAINLVGWLSVGSLLRLPAVLWNNWREYRAARDLPQRFRGHVEGADAAAYSTGLSGLMPRLTKVLRGPPENWDEGIDNLAEDYSVPGNLVAQAAFELRRKYWVDRINDLKEHLAHDAQSPQ